MTEDIKLVPDDEKATVDEENGVIELYNHNRKTVKEALAVAERAIEDENQEITDILIIGYDADDALVSISSNMSNKDALWLIERLKQLILSS